MSHITTKDECQVADTINDGNLKVKKRNVKKVIDDMVDRLYQHVDT